MLAPALAVHAVCTNPDDCACLGWRGGARLAFGGFVACVLGVGVGCLPAAVQCWVRRFDTVFPWVIVIVTASHRAWRKHAQQPARRGCVRGFSGSYSYVHRCVCLGPESVIFAPDTGNNNVRVILAKQW